MNITENKQVVLRFNKEFLEAGNAEVLKEIVAADFTNHTAAANFPKDISGLVQFVAMLHQGFSDLKIHIHEQVGEGDIVASRKTIEATHTGEIMGHAATGKRVVINVMDFVRLKDGKYVDHWGRNDIMQVIQSL
ncbi:MAG: ester cyclase [Bacteroidetes bacterium]|nr:ester cyclase [Bacteroidota bacterium]